MKLSVIIANYNYRDFVGAAIESALAVDWPDKEVIVVDDASTDDSRSIIEGFGGRVCRRKIEMSPGAQNRDDTPGRGQDDQGEKT